MNMNHIGVKDSSSLTDLVIVTSDVGGDLLVQRQGHCQRERGEKEENGGKQNHPLKKRFSWLAGTK